MQALQLNLATRPFRNNTLLWLGYGAATAALLAFSAYSVNAWVVNRTRLADLRTTVDSSEDTFRSYRERAAKAEREIDTYDLDGLGIQVAKANEMIEWQAFSWTRLFNRLAAIQPNDVKMVEIRPVFRGNRLGEQGMEVEGERIRVPVLVEGLAKDFDAWFDMQRALYSDPHFGGALPERVQRTRDTKEIVFTLGFDYYPEAEAPVEDLPADLADQEKADLEAAAPVVQEVADGWEGDGEPAAAGADAVEPATDANAEPGPAQAATSPTAIPTPAADPPVQRRPAVRPRGSRKGARKAPAQAGDQ